MIARDFDYILPESLEEARDAWREEKRAGKNPAYYGGGDGDRRPCPKRRVLPGLRHRPQGRPGVPRPGVFRGATRLWRGLLSHRCG